MIAAPIQVPYFTRRHIELAAQWLLSDYGSEHSPITEPPIPVEEILERHLGLDLSFCDLPQRVGIKDAQGALFVDEREVAVDQSLDPDEFPCMEGRFRFTLGHEIGHWSLHQRLYNRLLDDDYASFVSRPNQSHRRIERQADYFASYLLMPRPFVYQLWRHIFGGRAITLDELESGRLSFDGGEYEVSQATTKEEVNMILDQAAAPLADEFHVSPTAMRIRMEELKLILR